LALSFQEVQPIPGLRSRAEGGKEVVGNRDRDGDRGGSWRSWRAGAGAGLRLLQPGLHVSIICRIGYFYDAINSGLLYKRECHLCLKDWPLFIVCFDYYTSIKASHYVITVFCMHNNYDKLDELSVVSQDCFSMVVQCFLSSIVV